MAVKSCVPCADAAIVSAVATLMQSQCTALAFAVWTCLAPGAHHASTCQTELSNLMHFSMLMAVMNSGSFAQWKP